MTTTHFAATVALLSLVASAGAAPAGGRPNIVVILGDDMGYSDLGRDGGEIRTPNLDRLATGGLRFTQFYNTARCCPTRASLLTGLYPHQAGVGHMMEDKGAQFPGYRGDLNRNCLTIAEALRPAGYRSYMVGKWHVTRHIAADAPRHNWPLQGGFDRFYGMVSGGGSFFDPFTLARDNALISPFADPEYRPATYYFTDALTDHAVRFLGDHARDHRDAPFFLYLAYTAAHWPMHALPADIARYQGMYDQGYEPIRRTRFAKAAVLGLIDAGQTMAPAAGAWRDVEDKARETACMEVYAAMVDRMDQGIGKVVAELERSGQLENTLILFLQDNGGCAEDMGRKVLEKRVNGPRVDHPTLPPIAAEAPPDGLVPPQTRDGYPVRQGPKVVPGSADTYVAYGQGWAHVSNTPFREYKHWVHEGGISTPLVAHWPRGIPARGELRRQPGHLIDIMATCLDVAGATIPAERAGVPLPRPEGKSLVPAFADRPLDRDALYWEHEGNRAIRVGDWKLVAKGPAGAWELYDLAHDRVEANDVAPEQPARVQELARKWEEWARRSRVLPWIWKPAFQSTVAAAQAPAAAPADASLPAPGARGNADNVPFIGRRDPGDNPVRLVKATGHVSNYNEEKVTPYTLPDPLVLANGNRVTTPEQWFRERRPEILKLYQNEIYGRVPPGAPKVTWEVIETDMNARDGTAIMKRVAGRMGDKPDGPKMNLTVHLPAGTSKPVPVLLSITFDFGARARAQAAGNAEQKPAAKTRNSPARFDSLAAVLGHGWGYAALIYTDIQPDRADRWTEGVIGLTLQPGQTHPAADEWGTISAWAWGISRSIDFLETEKSVNPKQIAITGASRLGKTVLWAGAQDERVAAVFSVVSGEMGAALIRRDWGETLDDMAQNFPWQFAGNLQKWVGKWNDLPVDQHMLIALCAPRPVYVNGGLTDQWSDPKGEFLSMVAAGPVYRLLGKKDLGVTVLPPLDAPITGGDLAFHYHSSGHTAVPADWNAFLEFADRHFRDAAAK